MMFARKKEIKPLEQTYPIVAEELHFGLKKKSTRDQVASAHYRSAMSKYIKHRMSIDRCEQALERADITPAQKTPHIQKIAQENKISEQAHAKIAQQLKISQGKVDALPLEVFEQVAVDLTLIDSTPAEEKVTETNITEQLLADAKDKNALKEERQQQKEQDKATKTQAKDFYTAQEEAAKTLEADPNIEILTQRTTQLDILATELEQQAKPEEVKEVPKQVPPDYEKAMVAKQLNKQLQEPEPDMGFSDTGLQ